MSDPFTTPFDQPDPDAVARSERFVDALAKREPVDFVDIGDAGDTGDRALAGLLEDWRDELRVQGPRGVCAEQDAVAVLDRGVAGRQRALPPRNAHRSGDREGPLHAGLTVTRHRAVVGVLAGAQRDREGLRAAHEDRRLAEDLVLAVDQHEIV